MLNRSIECDDKVLDILELLGVEVITMMTARLMGAKFGQAAWTAGGLYDSINDVIIINENAHLIVPLANESIFNEVALHELCHWSGHSKRLGRISIVKSEHWGDIYSTIGNPTIEEMETEECIAQYGMYCLAIYCGLDENHYKNRLFEYTSKYKHADIELGFYKGKQAAEYIIERIERAKSGQELNIG